MGHRIRGYLPIAKDTYGQSQKKWLKAWHLHFTWTTVRRGLNIGKNMPHGMGRFPGISWPVLIDHKAWEIIRSVASVCPSNSDRSHAWTVRPTTLILNGIDLIRNCASYPFWAHLCMAGSKSSFPPIHLPVSRLDNNSFDFGNRTPPMYPFKWNSPFSLGNMLIRGTTGC